jgi:hypothetical protein
MVELMRALGKTIICMDKEFIHGVMAENMKENIIWTKNMVMEYTSGQTEGGMKVIGRMVNNMARVNTFCQMVSLKLGFGKMEKE